MTAEKLKNYLIGRGIESVKKTEKGGKLKGGVEGFEICRALKAPEDFQKKLSELWDVGQKALGNDAAFTKEKENLYCRARYQALQVEFVFERLKCAWRFPNVSARAALDYSEILEKESKEKKEVK